MERVSIIAPVYNEKENIKRFIEKVERALKKRFNSYEIILIDDGSTDGSKEILDKEAERNGHVKVYHFTKIMDRLRHWQQDLKCALENL